MVRSVGINPDVVEPYFTGTISRIGGIGLADMDRQMDAASPVPSTR